MAEFLLHGSAHLRMPTVGEAALVRGVAAGHPGTHPVAVHLDQGVVGFGPMAEQIADALRQHVVFVFARVVEQSGQRTHDAGVFGTDLIQAARQARRQYRRVDLGSRFGQRSQGRLGRRVATFGQARQAGRQRHGVGADDKALDGFVVEQRAHLACEQRRPQPFERGDGAQVLAGLDAEPAVDVGPDRPGLPRTARQP